MGTKEEKPRITIANKLCAKKIDCWQRLLFLLRKGLLKNYVCSVAVYRAETRTIGCRETNVDPEKN